MKVEELEAIKKYLQSVQEKLFTESSSEDLQEYQRGLFFGLSQAVATLSYLQGVVKYEDRTIEEAMEDMIDNDLDDLLRRMRDIKSQSESS